MSHEVYATQGAGVKRKRSGSSPGKKVPGTFSFLGVGAVKRGKALNRLQAVE
jgi:hypothetical protein